MATPPAGSDPGAVSGPAPGPQAAPDSPAGAGPAAPRRARAERRTRETSISCEVALAPGGVSIDLNGPGFFVHMLRTLATYAGWTLDLRGRGDVEVDAHHLVEDAGLVLGEALARSLGDFSGHARFGWALVPMDEALGEAALDAGRRPLSRLEADWPQPVTGDFELCLVEEFFRALCQKAGWTLHLTGRRGANSHHLCEAIFKAAGLAAKAALAERPGAAGPLSVKGAL